MLWDGRKRFFSSDLQSTAIALRIFTTKSELAFTKQGLVALSATGDHEQLFTDASRKLPNDFLFRCVSA